MAVEESYWEATGSIGAHKAGPWNTLCSILRVILNAELSTYEGELSSQPIDALFSNRAASTLTDQTDIAAPWVGWRNLVSCPKLQKQKTASLDSTRAFKCRAHTCTQSPVLGAGTGWMWHQWPVSHMRSYPVEHEPAGNLSGHLPRPSFFLIAHTFWLLKRLLRTIICFHMTVGKSGTELCTSIGELLVSTL